MVLWIGSWIRFLVGVELGFWDGCTPGYAARHGELDMVMALAWKIPMGMAFLFTTYVLFVVFIVAFQC